MLDCLRFFVTQIIVFLFSFFFLNYRCTAAINAECEEESLEEKKKKGAAFDVRKHIFFLRFLYVSFVFPFVSLYLPFFFFQPPCIHRRHQHFRVESVASSVVFFFFLCVCVYVSQSFLN